MTSHLLRSFGSAMRKPQTNLKAFIDAREVEFDAVVRETVEGAEEWRDLAPRDRRFAEAAE